MNFAEAALLIQGSTCVYSKKVSPVGEACCRPTGWCVAQCVYTQCMHATVQVHRSSQICMYVVAQHAVHLIRTGINTKLGCKDITYSYGGAPLHVLCGALCIIIRLSMPKDWLWKFMATDDGVLAAILYVYPHACVPHFTGFTMHWSFDTSL